jgi:lysophospholipase L1-like esterase
LVFFNTLLGGNSNEPAGSITDGGYNISDDTTCGFRGTGANGATIGDGVNTLLDPNGLKDNGGPTQTIALLPTSPAIDAIPVSPTNFCIDPAGNPVTTDQRGVARPQGPACDIGAFEFGATFTYVALGDSIATGQSRVSCEPALNSGSVSKCTATNPPPATRAYPARLNAKLQTVRPGSAVYNLSIWGATTVDVDLKELPQIGCPPVGGAGVVCPDLVTITVGADDLGVTDPITLVKKWFFLTTAQREKLAASLSAQLAVTLSNIVQTVHISAPKAKIVVLTDYPNPSDHLQCLKLASEFDDVFYAGRLTGLNEAVQNVANGTGATFTDAYGPFANHGIQSSLPWFFGTYCQVTPVINIPKLFSPTGFDPHPNGAGQQCYANLIWESIKKGLGSTEPPSANPCPHNLPNS